MRAGRRRWSKESESETVQDGQFGEEHKEQRRKVETEQERVVSGVVRRDEEESDGHRGEPLFCGSILRAFIDLFPECELVVRTRVGLKGRTGDVVEHDVRERHVAQVDKRPRRVLLHGGDHIEQDLGKEDEDDVDDPGALVVDPVGIGVKASGLVEHLFVGLFDTRYG